MFDLPVGSRLERKAANDFRLSLLDMGFEKAQLSVYIRYCSSHAKFETYCKKVESILPLGGKVDILSFTDKQYEKIITYYGRTKLPPPKNPDQFELF